LQLLVLLLLLLNIHGKEEKDWNNHFYSQMQDKT